MQESDDELRAHLARVYGARTPRELSDAYDRWAATYDHDMIDDLGWGGPAEAAGALTGRVPFDDPVLDVGAGTGLVGEALRRRGFTHLVAADLSEGMLEVARRRGTYQALHRVEPGPLPFADGHFAAVVSVGVLTQAHAPPESLRDWVRVVRSGGMVAFTLRPDLADELGFATVMRELEAAARWEMVFESGDLEGFRSIQSKPYRVWVYRVA